MAEVFHHSLFLQGPAGRLEAMLWTPASANPDLAAVRRDELVLYLVRPGAGLRAAQSHHGRMFPHDRGDPLRTLIRDDNDAGRMHAVPV